MKNKYRLILVIMSLVLMVFNLPNGFGFALGSLIITGLSLVREQYYKLLLSGSKFKTGSYLGYIFFLFLLLWVPLGIAFYYPNIIGPYGYAGAIFIDRMAVYVIGLFEEKAGVE